MRSDRDVVDMDELLDRIGDDREFAVELLREFRATLDEEIAALKMTLESMDAASVVQKSHSLKGSALNLSAKSFASAAKTIEEASKEGDVSGALAAFPSLVAEGDRLKEAIDKLC